MTRTTKDIIDQAIRENRGWEYLLFALACFFAIVGAVVITWSFVQKQPIATAAGVAETYLFWPALNLARGIRKANIMLRMLEIPLSKAATAQVAAEMLRRVFESHFLELTAGKRGLQQVGHDESKTHV